MLRNLTVHCKDVDAKAEAEECRDEQEPCRPEGDCIHGIHASTPVRLENLTVEYFAHDGIHIVGAECGKTVTAEDGTEVRWFDGLADGSYVDHCAAGGCGRDGFHFSGGDAQACVITGCSGTVNGRAGFYDRTFGNTYLGCHSEANAGPNYITDGEFNASVFINCWLEPGSPPSRFKGAVTIISGKIGGSYITKDSSAFILEHGVATRAPLVYKNLAGTKSIGSSLGDLSQTIQGPGAEMIAFQWATLISADDHTAEDSTWLHYLDQPGTRGRQWWALSNNDLALRPVIRFPTMQANARQAAPWFVNGIFLGRDDFGSSEDPPKVSFTAAPHRPDTQYSGAPLTYEKGDVVWNSEPSPGGPIGQVCIGSGTQSFRHGFQTGDPVSVGDTTVGLNKVDGLEPGQAITIGDGADAYTITQVTPAAPPATSTIDITPGMLISAPAGTAIAFTHPTAAPVSVGDTQVQLTNVDGFVPGQYITIGGGTDPYKIVKVTPATMDITPGAVIGVSVGAAIAIVSGMPTGVQTSKNVKAGDMKVMLNKAEGLMSGQTVTIGAGMHVYTIVNVTLPTLDIASLAAPPGAHAVVSVGQAVAFSPPTFSTFGEVVNIGHSTSYDDSTRLALEDRPDRYVTVTKSGKVMTLPASPVDGQTHAIKSQAGVITTVDTEGGTLTIDGMASATVAPGSHGTFRFSAATGEWELR